MPKQSIPQIIQTIKRGSGSGKVFRSNQVRPYLDKELREVAAAIKDFMFELIEVDARHNIRRDQSGLWENTKVTMTADGGKISLPDYAENIDKGRRPKARLVPLESLIQWIKRYRIVGRQKRTGKFRSASQSSVNAAARAIQQAIYKNGVRARPFIQATLEFQDVLIAGIIDEIMIPQIVSIVELTLSDKK
jgi:hypothetical protein